mmetsp:Transcript_8427/g.21047  ORF Transcript_8427/g.21047 Transcript_8427/m.21047 type:complete len:226 (-) Transcript_8427:3177-3854(-)
MADGAGPAHEHEENEDQSGQEPNEEEYEWLKSQLDKLAGEGGEITLEQLEMLQAAMAGEWQDPYDGNLTRLLDACSEGKEDEVAAVLEECADMDVNTPGPDGDSALHLAALFGHESIVKTLLERGADAGRVNEEDGSTPLHDAAASGFEGIVSLLLQAAPDTLKVADSDGDTPLHNAARGNHAAIVTALLKAGADPDAVNSEGNTPAQEAEEQVVKDLLTASSTH